jgi:hypothetical protein
MTTRSGMFITHPTTILNEEEEAVSEKLVEVYHTIMHDWELNANSGELAQAVHTFQLFIMKHALQRRGDTHWSSEWYGKDENETS